MKNSIFFKILLLTIGLIIFISSLYLDKILSEQEKLAKNRDGKKTAYGMVSGEIMPCTWEVVEPERVMSENKSQALLIKTKNSTEENCESIIALRAPGFDTSPYKDEQKVILNASGSGSISWILTPRKKGTFEIALSDVLNTKIIGITVTDLFGLTAGQVKFASVIGSLFGPMFTIPWWLDKWIKRKKIKDEDRNI